MRTPLDEIKDIQFDVVVIGAGVNGCSAAQHLAARGFTTLLVDKGDYGGGSSSRSSRLLHCGLRYLAPGNSVMDFVTHPSRFRTALRMARQAMGARSQFVHSTPQRARQLRFHFPVYKDGPYASWQLRLAFRTLKSLGEGGVPLDYHELSREEIEHEPLVSSLDQLDKVQSIFAFREYRFDWPERVCVDTAMDARRLGASVRNYTKVVGLERGNDGIWHIVLEDQRDWKQVEVNAISVVNTAGIWIDEVNRTIDSSIPRLVTGTKGAHIMVKLPSDWRDYGLATLNREGEPLYCIPWRGLHYFGPTETLYKGANDEVVPEDSDIDWILRGANELLPAIQLTRDDVLFTWAGVRPLTYSEALPMGDRNRKVHRFESEGVANLYAMTAGPIMSHRSAGIELAEAIKGAQVPSRTPTGNPSFGTMLESDAFEVGQLTSLSDGAERIVEDACRSEDVVCLTDLMFGRLGIGWTEDMGWTVAPAVARIAAAVLNWTESEVQSELSAYATYLQRNHWHTVSSSVRSDVSGS